MRTTLTKAQRHVLRYLSEHAAGGVTHVSVRALARELELSSSTARIAIKRLNDLGLVATSAVSRARPGEHLVLAWPVAISLQLGMAKSLHVTPVPVAISTESTPVPVAISPPGPVAISLQTPGPVAISPPGPVAISTAAITTRAPELNSNKVNKLFIHSSRIVEFVEREMGGEKVALREVREELAGLPEAFGISEDMTLKFFEAKCAEWKRNGYRITSPKLFAAAAAKGLRAWIYRNQRLIAAERHDAEMMRMPPTSESETATMTCGSPARWQRMLKECPNHQQASQWREWARAAGGHS